MKIAIIGAGSGYTPELLQRLHERRAALPVTEVVLHDIDHGRLERVAGFCRRFMARIGADFSISATIRREAALAGADFVNVQIRVGGNRQRGIDERICRDHGVIGQETTGAVGLMKALRTIPAMVDIAREVGDRAWIINYANPTGLVTEAVRRATPARIAGLCSGPLMPGWWLGRALGIEANRFSYAYGGLNHLSAAWEPCLDGQPLSEEHWERFLAVHTGPVDSGLLRRWRIIPSPYFQYFWHRRRTLDAFAAAPFTRGEEVEILEQAVGAAYADPARDTLPPELARRGGGGYAEVAIQVMEALHSGVPRRVVVNTANRGCITGLPDDAVVEVPCLVDRAGIVPLVVGELPAPLRGLVAAVKAYERLAVQAALGGDRNAALDALIAHPLVGDADRAVSLLADLLAANRQHLPWAA